MKVLPVIDDLDRSILAAYETGTISEETAGLFASKKGRITRGIDLFKKTRGIDNQAATGLRLDLPVGAGR